MSLISVIVPVYNVEQYVAEAIESLLHQDGCELEIILIDDGSTDRSGEIAQQYANRYDNIICIHQSNQGLSAARNTGIDHAHGEYVMFLDSDDTFEEHSIAPLEKKMTRDKLDLLLFSGKKVYEDRQENVTFGPTEEFGPCSGVEMYVKLRNTHNYYTCVVFMMIRRSYLLEYGIVFVEQVLHEDHAYAFEIIVNADKAACVATNIYNYRIRENSIMTGSGRLRLRFSGFYVCYTKMNESYAGIIEKMSSPAEVGALQQHMTEIAIIAAKYIIKMSREEILIIRDDVKDFIWNQNQAVSTRGKLYIFSCKMKYWLSVGGSASER